VCRYDRQAVLPLSELVAHLGELDDDLTIFVNSRSDWTTASLAVIVPPTDYDHVLLARYGMTYLLEVVLAKEVVEVWSNERDGRSPTVEEACEAIIYHARHDAYIAQDRIASFGDEATE
jgi:hypothetical protein